MWDALLYNVPGKYRASHGNKELCSPGTLVLGSSQYHTADSMPTRLLVPEVIIGQSLL